MGETHNESGEVTGLALVAASDASLPHQLVDEGIDDGGGDGLRQLEVEENEQLELWERVGEARSNSSSLRSASVRVASVRVGEALWRGAIAGIALRGY